MAFISDHNMSGQRGLLLLEEPGLHLRKLSRSHDHITMRFPVIPGVNDADQDISQFGSSCPRWKSWIGYHKLGMEKYKRLGMRHRMAEMRPPTSEEITGIAETLRRFGLSVRIGG